MKKEININTIVLKKEVLVPTGQYKNEKCGVEVHFDVSEKPYDIDLFWSEVNLMLDSEADSIKEKKEFNEEFPTKETKVEPIVQSVSVPKVEPSVATIEKAPKPCPKCGQATVEGIKKDGSKFLKCSTQKWSKTEGQTGCDYVDWNYEKLDRPATEGQLKVIREKIPNKYREGLTFSEASEIVGQWVKTAK